MTQTDPNIEKKAGYGVEELQVVGEQLLTKVKELIHEGNVRRIIIKQEGGNTILEIPLTVGVVGILALPQLAAIGAVCALVTRCSIEVVRTEEPFSETPSETSIDEIPPAGPSAL
ncbi:MAG TPA: DUF4342 domain-containing protein [Ktedonobacteraceae bacterium]|nr:DUF4342 domain-containing protein [Ktedonobacteraceae bacterium]